MKPRFYALPIALLSCSVVVPVFAQNDAGTPPATNGMTENRPIPQRVLIFPPKDSGLGTLRANRTRYQPGERVAFTFTIANPTNKAVGYDFPSSQQFDVTVSDPKNAPVWDSAQGMVFAQGVTHLTLKPGQKKSFEAVWNGRDVQGRPVAPGVYSARARLTSSNRPAVTGGIIVDPDTDPDNTGFPTRSPAENGAVRQVDMNPPITASLVLAIGVPAPKK